jgi:hypothetical protein
MHRVVNSVVFSSALVLVVGCAADDYDGGIFVRQAVAPGDGCSITAQIGEIGVSHGALSSLSPTAYVITAQMQSKITADTMAQVPQRTVLLTAANVDLTFPGSTLFTAAELADMKSSGITHFKSLFSAALGPNLSIVDAPFEITTPALYDKIYAKAPEAKGGSTPFALEVLATFTVVGDLSGTEVNSQPFEFPISIATNNVFFSAGTCPLPMGTILEAGDGCGRAQDGAFTCCESPDGLVCPATIGTAP